MNRSTSPAPLVHLAAEYNVGVAVRALAPGEKLKVGRTAVTAVEPIPSGHKIALRPIAAGEKVLKHAAAIGSATRAIAPGEHVHVHNLGSDYLPTRLRPTTDRNMLGEKEEGAGPCR